MPRAYYTAGALCAACLGAVLLSACSPGASKPDPGDAATLRMGNGGEPKSLDPQIVTGLIEERLLSSMFEGLVNLDFETMQPIPGVAEAWEVSIDDMVYIFDLNKDAKWSNGDPVTAHDFVYSWKRILSPGLAAEYAYMLYPIKNAEAFNRGDLTDFSEVGVRALGEHALEVTLRAPTPYFFALQTHFTFYPVHQGTIEAHGGMLDRDTPWTRPGNFVSNGPFTLSAWSPNKEIVVSKNTYYWDRDAVQLETIVFRPIQNPTVEERIFRAGEIDLTYGVPLTKIPTYQRDHPEVIRIDPYIATEFIRFNTTRKPFDDPRVRNALALAIDRETIVARVMKGGQTAANSFTPPNTGGYAYNREAELDRGIPGSLLVERKVEKRLLTEEMIHKVRAERAAKLGPGVKYAPDEARRLLAEAGYADGRGFPEVALLHDTNDNVRIYCEALQHMWKKELNIDIQLQNQEGKTWLANMIALNYDIARSFWAADYPDASNFLEIFLSNTGNNRTGFNNPEYEDLLRRASTLADDTERNALYNAAETILLSDAPITPVYHQTRAYLVSPWLQGLQSNNLGRINYKDLYFTALVVRE